MLDSLPMTARTTGNEAAARSRLVRRLRIALPALALVLVAAFIFNTRSDEGDDAFLKDFEDITASAEELRMASPRFSGIDNNGRPFEITAAAAIQNPQSKDIVQLERPKAVQGEADELNTVTANAGVYRSDRKILELTDQVTLEHEVGADTYIFNSPSATVFIDDETVTSDAGVGGIGPKGETLQADKMKAYNSEGRVVLEGNVHMRIFPKSNTGSERQSPPELKDPAPSTPQQ
ncbi:LPS export ABC transporter periplasmic protein LptC [Hyphococcus flavus]|uniref:LPS export ABC transporter periplasmic protein LptC n=1 Tax=Hyphococcus flavus TaxID=1866326 RepID=A0AAE9ZEQ0_9PROT|nr:LPS export ABC transporter periplasmic protein LptC [Hyphococcus flavus]WDI31762.1 LPS export ABC transporter periplasmic protein LptC [Hyphococcus flavus]